MNTALAIVPTTGGPDEPEEPIVLYMTQEEARELLAAIEFILEPGDPLLGIYERLTLMIHGTVLRPVN